MCKYIYMYTYVYMYIYIYTVYKSSLTELNNQGLLEKLGKTRLQLPTSSSHAVAGETIEHLDLSDMWPRNKVMEVRERLIPTIRLFEGL